MKEKINKFFYKGWHLLAGVWLNVAFMGYAVIDGLVEGSWQHALIGVLIYLPWLLLFIEMYRNHKMHQKKVLNLLKDATAASLPGLTENDTDEPEPEAFRPKEGDICTYLEYDEPSAIFLFNGKEHVNEDGIRILESELSVEYSGNLLQPYIVIRGEGQEVSADDCRLATEQEAALFHEKVKNTDKKDENWVPRKGDAYWAPSFDYDYGEFEPVKVNWEGKSMEVYTHRRGWSFRSEERCRKLCNKLNEAIKNVKL